ncbi:hypothetical protein TNCV_1754881 [Trichonephila clavipes]|nr:hypothetical protein TNCV_1754881 [Trichonephila clavipes]
MPPNTLRVHTEYVLAKSVGPKVLSQQKPRVQGTGEYFASPPVPCLNSGGGDKWCRHISCKKSNLSQTLATFISVLREGHENSNKVYFTKMIF